MAGWGAFCAIKLTAFASIDLMWFPPWQDYNDRARVALLEINGVEAPRGTVGPDLEYLPPEKPTGKPWDRVVDWKRACVALAPGDFAHSCVLWSGPENTTMLRPSLRLRLRLRPSIMKAVDTKPSAHTHIGTKADGRELRASIFENGGNGENAPVDSGSRSLSCA